MRSNQILLGPSHSSRTVSTGRSCPEYYVSFRLVRPVRVPSSSSPVLVFLTRTVHPTPPTFVVSMTDHSTSSSSPRSTIPASTQGRFTCTTSGLGCYPTINLYPGNSPLLPMYSSNIGVLPNNRSILLLLFLDKETYTPVTPFGP